MKIHIDIYSAFRDDIVRYIRDVLLDPEDWNFDGQPLLIHSRKWWNAKVVVKETNTSIFVGLKIYGQFSPQKAIYDRILDETYGSLTKEDNGYANLDGVQLAVILAGLRKLVDDEAVYPALTPYRKFSENITAEVEALLIGYLYVHENAELKNKLIKTSIVSSYDTLDKPKVIVGRKVFERLLGNQSVAKFVNVQPEIDAVFIEKETKELKFIISQYLRHISLFNSDEDYFEDLKYSRNEYRIRVFDTFELEFKKILRGVNFGRWQGCADFELMEKAKISKIDKINIWDVNIYQRNLSSFVDLKLATGIFANAMVYYEEGIRLPIANKIFDLSKYDIENLNEFVEFAKNDLNGFSGYDGIENTKLKLKEIFKFSLFEQILNNSKIPIDSNFANTKYIEVKRLYKFRFRYVNGEWKMENIEPIFTDEISIEES